MKIRLITDSAADLPKDYVLQHNIEVMPLKIRFGEETFTDGVDMDTNTFYEKMSTSQLLPVTSLPSPQAFKDLFEKDGNGCSILCITISSATSGTYQSALLAANEINHTEIEVIDSLNISMGTGLLVMRANDLISMGLSLQEIKEDILSFRHTLNTFIAIDNLENVIKGGRISNWKGSIAQFLNIKPILNIAPDGSLKALDYVRGRKNQLKKVIQRIKATDKEISNNRFVILHAKAPLHELQYLEEEISRIFNPKEIMIGELGPVMGSHGGFGAIGFAF